MISQGSKSELLVVGLSHRTAPIELRERVAFDPVRTDGLCQTLMANQIVSEVLVLSTCNRSELYAVHRRGEPSYDDAIDSSFAFVHGVRQETLNGHLYRYRNGDAARHLYRVAASLDSQFLGEAEIQGQVRDAYLHAVSLGVTGPVLNRVFQAALEVGKRVRSETGIGSRPVSVAFAGVKLAERIFGKLNGHCALVLGAGSVAEQLVYHLRERGISRLLISNRTREHAESLSRRFGGEIVPLESLGSLLGAPDVIVCSVAASGRLLSRVMLEHAMSLRGNRPLFLIDLAVPRNVDPLAAELYSIYVYNTDDLSAIVEENLRGREAEIPTVEVIIAQHVSRFESWQAAAELVATWTGLGHDERKNLIEARAREIFPDSLEDRRCWIRKAGTLLDTGNDMNDSPGSRPQRRRRDSMRVLRLLFGYMEEKP